jgi:DNA-directed RNA polymerase specialized sigma24 family protein
MNTHLDLHLSLVSSRSLATTPTTPRPAVPRSASSVVELPATALDRTALKACFGDRGAVGELARSYYGELVTAARLACKNQHDAEDAVQEFWLALLEKRMTQFPPRRGQAREWMRGVVECLALGQRIERWYAMRWHEEDERPTAPAKKEV